MIRPLVFVALFGGGLAVAQVPPTISAVVNQPVFNVSDVTLKPDAVEAIDAIRDHGDADLLKSLGRGEGSTSFGHKKLEESWALPMGDGNVYYLYLYDEQGRTYPGSAMRTLVLLNIQRKVVAWGEFDCSPSFHSGIAYTDKYGKGESFLVTMNFMPRFGGHVVLEKYQLTPTSITRLGVGQDLSKLTGRSDGE